MNDFLKTAWKVVLVLGVFLGIRFAPYINSTLQRMLNPQEERTVEDFLSKPFPGKNLQEMPTGEMVTVSFLLSQYVYFCFEQDDLSKLILAPTIVDARALFEFFRIPDETGLPRCDYLVNNDTLEYVRVSKLENLRRLPTQFLGPTATQLPATGAVYQGNDGEHDYYVYLAPSSLSPAGRFLVYDFITTVFGPKP